MFGFIGGLGMPELIVILVLALIIFGPGKLPDVGRALGKSINEFKRASREVQKEITEAVKDEPKSEGDSNKTVG
ncbi:MULTISPECIES: twin-arginine translocase TatA/TatE family subunit [Carboxydocella]|uniref:Sec-independent protein translocase protein TatA n=2 Tax=Carboxydocella TaxID=178898 RepID=A0A1T4N2B8_9FIRM|nr:MULTISPECIES: twin-arginine translocase TatA/TatE family subunit [Carboxydocella]AVX20887.1 Sec-independent protein translocase TatA [Carboxydocella thermautotrophica]AVX31302.1 Sec-independent protein translocase TatA [Carboxydocella thermautotrophica]SJZ73352.1 Sec-independent protein translocase TatA [Carboxydocella sporoproducens DSM 16521]GAW29950.1 protein translocase TatA [Carboxydocella sp. ULO1]GAW30447.1 protein translocase TatA [Carboxydocella sp. JDF658]